MTIEKGKEWGQVVPTPSNVVVVEGDKELTRAWEEHNDNVFSIKQGDLFNALGRPSPDLSKSAIRVVPVDLLRVVVLNYDDTTHTQFAVSSVEVGSWRSRRRYVCVSNTGFVGFVNIAPRAHPNDGEMDVVTVSAAMDWRQRFIAHRRAQLGNHVPHPHISMQRGAEGLWSREHRREVLRIDGHRVDGWREIAVSVVPDACLLAL
jgi:hypothetical protein